MVQSILQGFVKNSEESLDKDQQQLNKNIDSVKKNLVVFNKRFNQSVKSVKSIVNTIDDSRTRKELQEVLAKAESLKGVEKRLKQKGSSVTSKEAKAFLEVAKTLNQITQTNETVIRALREQKVNVEELDVEKPLKTASKKIGQDASEFFVDNAQAISQSGLGQDATTAGLNAVSPVLGAVTESLGVNPIQSVASLFSDKESEDDTKAIVQAERQTASTVTEAIENSTAAEKMGNDDLIQAEQRFHEERIVLAKDQHAETLEALDDIENANARQRGTLGKLFGKGGRFSKLFSPFAKLLVPFTALAGLLKGGAGKLLGGLGAVAGGLGTASRVGIAGAGAVVGIDAFRDILGDEGLTTGNALQAAGSGALIGSAFGPLGALIGGGVGGIAAIIAGSLKEEDIKKIKTGFASIKDFFGNTFKGLVDKIGPTIANTVDLLGKFVKDPIKTIDDFFDGLGGFVDSTVQAVVPMVKSTFESAKSMYNDAIDTVSSAISDVGTFFTTKVDAVSASIGEGIDRSKKFFSDTLDSFMEIPEKIGMFFTDIIESFTTKLPQPIKRLLGFETAEEAEQAGDNRGTIDKFFGGFFESDVPEEPRERTTRAQRRRRRSAQNVTLPTPPQESAAQLQADIAQATTAAAIAQSTEKQITESKVQSDKTTKLIQDSQRKAQEANASSNGGISSLDNTPIMSTDVGLALTVGGGI